MIKINHILPVVCLFLFVQCANQARLSDDIEALKKQVTDNSKRSRALEAEATALKQVLTDNTTEFDRRIRSLPLEGMTEQEQEDFGLLKKTMCSALEFVKYFKEVFKSEIEIDKTSNSGAIGNLRVAIADCIEALGDSNFNPPSITNSSSSSVPTTITTPIRTNNTSPRSEGESAATASIRLSPE